MNEADQLAWLGIFFVVLVYFLGVIVGFFIGRSGEQDQRTRRDLADAERMRATIREYDDRVSEFAPRTIRHSESVRDRAIRPGR